ncbi:membrane protein insertion efficiency factor YidD [Singulisphaera sp. PoT]|uniref:membrane protein insertion efficiency factor YidD n=1 Tax=Singulisphaera sp. PoT TaxID=3411797 RepID=UPI003BF46225
MTYRALLRWPEQALIGLLILAIRVYQKTLGPLLSASGPVCRFEPSCSRYTIEALKKYGLIRGATKGLLRFLSCHPWHPGGYDPP